MAKAPKKKAAPAKKPAAKKPVRKAKTPAKKPATKRAKKETTQEISSIAARGLRIGKLTPAEIRKVSASALGQDETKGPRKKGK